MEPNFSSDDIKREWTKLEGLASPFNGSLYTTWRSPDKKLIATIHEADGELAGVREAKTGKIVYEHPKTTLGRKMLGL